MLFDYPNEICVLPENADRVLFAEDFVNFILKTINVPYQFRSGIADHRARIYNAFNPDIEVAASYSCYSYKEDIDIEFREILNQIVIDSNDFIKYVEDLTIFVNPYPMPVGLMYFCVKISMMAGKFYRRGCLDAPFHAFQMIVKFLNSVRMDQGGYRALNYIARQWSQDYVDLDMCIMTPDLSPESDRPHSDPSNSPEHEIGGVEGQDNIQEELSDDGMHVEAVGSPSEESVSSNSDSERIDTTCDVKAGIIVKSAGSTSDYSLSGSYGEKNSEGSSHSYEDTSSDEESKQNKENKKLPCSNSKKYRNSPKKREKDLNTVDYKDSSDMHLNEKH